MTEAVSSSKRGPMLSGPAALLFANLITTVVSSLRVTGSQNQKKTTDFGL